MRPADAPSVKSRSRRVGTWKEWTTRTATSSTVKGLMIDVMPPAGALTAWKNQTQAAMAPRATRIFTHPGGRARVACEKAVPAETSAMAPIAVVQAISCREAHAAMATSTAPRQASRNRIESSGTPGWLARRTASDDAHDPDATARVRRRRGRDDVLRCGGRPPSRRPGPTVRSSRAGPVHRCRAGRPRNRGRPRPHVRPRRGPGAAPR